MGCGGSKSTAVIDIREAERPTSTTKDSEADSGLAKEDDLSDDQESQTAIDKEAEFYAGLQTCTRLQFIEHNEEKKERGEFRELWTTDSRYVYNGYALYQSVRSAVDSAISDRGDQLSSLCSAVRLIQQRDVIEQTGAYNQTMHFLRGFGLPREVFKEAKMSSAVAKIEDDLETFSQLDKDHLMLLLGDLQNCGENSEHLKELARCAERHLLRLDGPTSVTDGEPRDPNGRVFSLPDGVSPEELRVWLNCWPQFDCDIEEGESAWQTVPRSEEVIVREDDTLEKQVRTWLESWQPLQFNIDGEAAWQVLPEDVISKDEATEWQLEVLRIREDNPSLASAERMRVRRAAIAGYLLKVHDDWPTEKLEPYVGWADRLQRCWEQFQELCRTWQEPRRPTSVQSQEARRSASRPGSVQSHNWDKTASRPTSVQSQRGDKTLTRTNSLQSQQADKPASRPSSVQSQQADKPASRPNSGQSQHADKPASRPNSGQSQQADKPASRPNSVQSQQADKPASRPNSAQSQQTLKPASRPSSGQSQQAVKPASRPSSVQSQQADKPASRPSSVQSQQADKPASRPNSVQSQQADKPASRPNSGQSQQALKPTSRPSSVQSQHADKPASRPNSVQSQQPDKPASRPNSVQSQHALKPASRPSSVQSQQADKPASRPNSVQSQQADKPASRPNSVQSQHADKPASRPNSIQSQHADKPVSRPSSVQSR